MELLCQYLQSTGVGTGPGHLKIDGNLAQILGLVMGHPKENHLPMPMQRSALKAVSFLWFQWI